MKNRRRNLSILRAIFFFFLSIEFSPFFFRRKFHLGDNENKKMKNERIVWSMWEEGKEIRLYMEVEFAMRKKMFDRRWDCSSEEGRWIFWNLGVRRWAIHYIMTNSHGAWYETFIFLSSGTIVRSGTWRKWNDSIQRVRKERRVVGIQRPSTCRSFKKFVTILL